MSLYRKVEPGAKISLDGIDASFTGGLDKERAAKRLEELNEEMGELQDLLYAAREHSVLIVLQGMDTSGKDGTIKNVMRGVNPTGCRVESFKVPTEEELAHDFLWRVHKLAPARGLMTIFNRSHYEDVVVVRVHNLVPEGVLEARYEQINNFEKLLAGNDTIILKFYLHITNDEQRKRLEAREEDVGKAWKLSVGDWKERKLWDDYMRAYQDALSRCSADYAPWHIIPANKKWFRDVAVAECIRDALEPYATHWKESLSEMAEEKLAELKAWQAETRPERL